MSQTTLGVGDESLTNTRRNSIHKIDENEDLTTNQSRDLLSESLTQAVLALTLQINLLNKVLIYQ